MSRQKGRRRPPGQRSRPSQGHFASSDKPEPWPELGHLLASHDPMIAEAFASSVLAPFVAGYSARFPDEPPPPTPDALVDGLVAAARMDTLVALYGISAIASQSLADRARRGIAKLARKGLRAPDWFEFIGTAETTTTHLLRDVLDDGVSVFMGFAYPKGAEHTVNAYIDHNLGYIVKDIFISGSPEEVADLVRTEGESLVALESVDAAEARARVEQGLFELNRTWHPAVSDEVFLNRALLDARLALLPGGGTAPERAQPSEEEITALRDEFLAAPEAADLPNTEDVADIAAMLVRYEADYGTGNPLRWSPVVAELCLADWFPRKVLADREYFEQVPAVAEAWARFTFRKRDIEDLGEGTIDAVRLFSREMVQSQDDPSRWGPGKQIAAAMAESNVDVLDPEAVRDWVDEYNAGVVDDWDDDDDDEFLAAWARVDAEGVGLLQEMLQNLRGKPPPHAQLAAAAAALRSGYESRYWPFDIMANALGYGEIPSADEDVVVAAAGALIALAEPTGLDPEEESLVTALQHADWLGAIVGAVRAGVGSPVDAETLARYVDECPEIEGELTGDDRMLVETAFEIVWPTWEAAGVTADGHLTALGVWALPRALAAAWDGSFD